MEEASIKKYRNWVGLTQEEMAEKLNIHQTSYSDKERGKSKFTVYEFIAMQIHLGLTDEQLLNEMKKQESF